ncbi:hypothetical protein BHE74_00043858 [Ensete ventricosum]|nr:hypothetical protein BHE74_00043858 [Ensete ventricosum]
MRSSDRYHPIEGRSACRCPIRPLNTAHTEHVSRIFRKHFISKRRRASGGALPIAWRGRRRGFWGYHTHNLVNAWYLFQERKGRHHRREKKRRRRRRTGITLRPPWIRLKEKPIESSSSKAKRKRIPTISTVGLIDHRVLKPPTGDMEVGSTNGGGSSLPSVGTDAMKRRVCYFYHPAVGDFYSGTGHLMRPFRLNT